MTGTLTMPKNYVAIEAEEMEYLDGGGWSGRTFANNLLGLAVRSARAFAVLGITKAQITSIATFSYAMAATKFGTKIVTAASIVGGIVGGLIAALAAGLAINHLGRHSVWG